MLNNNTLLKQFVHCLKYLMFLLKIIWTQQLSEINARPVNTPFNAPVIRLLMIRNRIGKQELLHDV